jgi:hypothetical protein
VPIVKSYFGWVVLFTVALGLVLSFTFLTRPGPVYAAPQSDKTAPPGPDRFTNVTVDYTLHEWWIIAWKDSKVYCSFYADHEGLPNNNDVLAACGEDIYVEWKAYSFPCTTKDTTTCIGYYMVEVSSKPAQKEIAVKLPPPQVWISIEECNPDPDGWCSTQPKLILTGEEPLPNESITSIHGLAGGDPFACTGNRCEFSLEKTDSKGVTLQFWAYSTYGDSSESFSADVRVLTQGGGESDQRLVKRWYVDVLSPQWIGSKIASCAITWDAFPPTEGLPEWLTTPDAPEKLMSSIPYAYLAGNLISQGVVDVSTCSDGGLNTNGTATTCGMEAAKPAVSEWQNQFDSLIFDNSTKTDIPAQLLKNLFSRESQFWPGVFRAGADVGLGQLTENGADTILLWNRTFFDEFCPLVLDKNTCANNSYSKLNEEDNADGRLNEAQRKLLRGALVASVDATCQNCPLGLDLSRANFSVSVFGRTLLANCEQTGKAVQNLTGKVPGQALSYEDLWKLTLVNYNAGPGCLADALEIAQQQVTADNPLGWASISRALAPACQGAVSYVNDISKPSTDK